MMQDTVRSWRSLQTGNLSELQLKYAVMGDGLMLDETH